MLGITWHWRSVVAWYLTDSDLRPLPQRLKTLHLPEWVTLWQAHEPKPVQD